KTREFARNFGYPTTADDCYVAPNYQKSEIPPSRGFGVAGRDQRSDFVGQAFLPAEQTDPGKRERVLQKRGYSIADDALVATLQSRKPKHIIIGIGGGMQDKLGSYLKHQLTYRPGIYCIGAAPGFVTGDQIVIPMWADRFFVGWILRIIGRPRDYVTRYWNARLLPLLIIKYGTR